MNMIMELALGILTAVGGFIDIGELVFNIRAGALFGYQLLWAILVGVLIIITYAEMSGRVAAITKKPVSLLLRDRLGFTLGSCAIVASVIVNILTCSAELGGVAIVLHLLTGLPYIFMVPVSVVLLGVIIWISTFKIIERVFGFLGLFMMVFIFAIVSLHPQWNMITSNLIPHVPHTLSQSNLLLYFYFAIGIISATIMPYEAFFYSSGGIEEKWEKKDLHENVITTIFGFTLGSLLSVALIVIGAILFLPRQIDPQLLNTAIMGPMVVFGKLGIILALIGVFFAISGAAIETSLSTAYNITQFFHFQWGEQKKPQQVPQFTISWVAVFGIALITLLLGVDPISLTEYAVIFSVVILPLTYLPILLTADDKKVMGKYANPIWLKSWGWFLLVIITLVALATIPLSLTTHMGQG